MTTTGTVGEPHPTSDKPKTVMVSVRIKWAGAERIQALADQQDVSFSEALRTILRVGIHHVTDADFGEI